LPDIHLRIALGDHAIGDLMRGGEFIDPRVDLEFVRVDPIHRAFAPMVREQAYDISELAIVSALQAVAYDHPVVVLPIVPASRFQRKCLISHRSNPITDPTQLRGRRVGVRAYTQTTGFWVRSHLAEDFGVAADESHWVTQEGAHVPEYRDPPFVDPTWPGSLVDALRFGSIDAVILGNDLPSGDEFVPVFDHAAERDRVWYDVHGYAPINHVVVVATSTLQREPEAVRAAYGLLSHAEGTAAHAAAMASPDAPRLTMSGLDRLTGPIEEIAAACFEQGLLPRPLTAEDVLGPARRLLEGAYRAA
jgi:4,5-dihydroxyphthalate decarboxylase